MREPRPRNETEELVRLVTERHGRLAMARAAGEAAAAKGAGDKNRSAVWYDVVAELRRALVPPTPRNAV